MSVGKMHLEFVVLLFCFGQLVYAQKTDDASLLSFEGNACQLNDEMLVLEIEKPDDLWNLGEIKPLNKNNLRIKQYQPDTLSLVFKGGRTYLSQMKDKIFLVGKESPLLFVDYIRPEQLLAFPFSRNDSICGYFVGEGKYSDKVAVREFGKYQTKLVEQRPLQLSSGKVLSDACLLQTVRNIQVQYTPIADTASQRSPLSVDSIRWHLERKENIVQERVNRIYVKGYRYPILELVEQRDADNHLLFHHCYYISPEAQETIGIDAYNDVARKQMEKEDDNSSENQIGQTYIPDKPYQFFYDREACRIVLRNIQVKESAISLVVSDTRGIIYKQQTARLPDASISVDCRGLMARQYVLLIKTDVTTYVEKFIKV